MSRSLARFSGPDRGKVASVKAILEQGLKSAENAEFVAKLEQSPPRLNHAKYEQ